VPQSLSIWGFLVLLPLHTSLSIPLELGYHAISKGTLSFNAFRTWVCLKFACNGRIKRSPETIAFISTTLSISTKTVQAHIDYLEINGFLNYDKVTNTLFVWGFNKVCQKKELSSRRAVCVWMKDIKHLKEQLFSACVLSFVKAAPRYKKKTPEYSGLKASPLCRIEFGTSAMQGRKMFLANGYEDYLGVSCSLTSGVFHRSPVWSSRMKQRSSKIGILRYEKMGRVLIDSAQQINIKAASFAFPLEFHKSFLATTKDGYLMIERLADKMKTNVVLVRKRGGYDY
jgi:hypothetical protein